LERQRSSGSAVDGEAAPELLGCQQLGSTSLTSWFFMAGIRRFFLKRDIDSTTAIIAGAISANALPVAPVALAKSVTAVALTKGATVSGSTLTLIKGALKIMAWTNANTAIVAGSVVVLIFAGVSPAYLHFHRHSDLTSNSTTVTI
jgi:hypothetical protein